MKTRWSFVLPALLFAASAQAQESPTSSAERSSVFTGSYGYAKPLKGYVQFCMEFPQDCISVNTVNLRVRLTPAAHEELMQINISVNREIEPLSDIEQYEVEERWTYPDSGKGDCEDYVLLKRKRLVDAGWEAGVLLITYVKDELDDGHAVLMVRTDQGDLILDNKRNEILLWQDTGYTFRKRQSAIDPKNWISLVPPSHEHTSATPLSEEDGAGSDLIQHLIRFLGLS